MRPADASNGDTMALPDGLRLRVATAADAELIGDLVEAAMPHPGVPLGQKSWALDLADGVHPTCSAADFSVVEELATGRLVSCMTAVEQRWSYAGLPLPIAVPEVVVTLPEYRNRGLVHAQFDRMHRRCDARGLLFQAIDGILDFYRQFGYEPALALKGYRIAYKGTIPRQTDEDRGRFVVRRAVADDASFIATVYAAACSRSLLACERGESIWRYELSGRRSTSTVRLEIAVVEEGGRPIGVVAHEPHLDSGQLRVFLYELAPGVSWLGPSRAVLGYLWTAGEHYAHAADRTELAACELYLGESHPLFTLYADELPGKFPPISWYVRVPDLSRLVRTIGPVLERRLAASILTGHAGELRLGFSRGGLRFRFAGGRIVEVSPWDAREPATRPDAVFPERTFLQLLFGYRSLPELRQSFADCWTWGKADVLLDILFPKVPSNVLSIV